jgi:hypothetical protein
MKANLDLGVETYGDMVRLIDDSRADSPAIHKFGGVPLEGENRQVSTRVGVGVDYGTGEEIGIDVQCSTEKEAAQRETV